MSEPANPLQRASLLLAASTHTTEIALAALYVAEAKLIIASICEEVGLLQDRLDAREEELVRQHRAAESGPMVATAVSK
jgi:hypothetical protein